MLCCTYCRYKIEVQNHKKHWIVEGSEYGLGFLLILVSRVLEFAASVGKGDDVKVDRGRKRPHFIHHVS